MLGKALQVFTRRAGRIETAAQLEFALDQLEDRLRLRGQVRKGTQVLLDTDGLAGLQAMFEVDVDQLDQDESAGAARPAGRWPGRGRRLAAGLLEAFNEGLARAQESTVGWSESGERGEDITISAEEAGPPLFVFHLASGVRGTWIG